MMKKPLPSADRFPIFAVYRAGNCVFADPRFFGEIKNKDRLPDIAAGKEKLAILSPWQVLANRFSLNGIQHTLFSFILPSSADAGAAAEAELAALPLTEFFRDLLSCTSTRFTLPEPLSPKLFFNAVVRDITSEVCDRITANLSIGTGEGMIEASPRGFFYALGILLTAYYYNGRKECAQDATLSMTSLPEAYQIRLQLPAWQAPEFLLHLLDALAAPSGFQAKCEEDGFLFRFPAVRRSSFALRTHPETEFADILQDLRRLFGGAQTPENFAE